MDLDFIHALNEQIIFHVDSITKDKKWQDWPGDMDGEGGGGFLSLVWCKTTDLEVRTGASEPRFGQEQNEFLWLFEAQSLSSSNRRVCLFILRLEPVSFKWHMEPCALEGAASSEKGTWCLSCLWSDELFCPRLLLFFSASHLARLPETLPD